MRETTEQQEENRTQHVTRGIDNEISQLPTYYRIEWINGDRGLRMLYAVGECRL